MNRPPPKLTLFPSPPLFRFFAGDGYFATSAAVNGQALTTDRVLLLVYPRLWLRPDLLASTSTTAEVNEATDRRSEEHTSELQSPCNLVCRLLLEKKKPTRSP